MTENQQLLINDLAVLVRRLIARVARNIDEIELATEAQEFLNKHGLGAATPSKNF